LFIFDSPVKGIYFYILGVIKASPPYGIQVECRKNRLLAILRQDSPKNIIWYRIPVGLLFFKKKFFQNSLSCAFRHKTPQKSPRKSKINIFFKFYAFILPLDFSF
jgi:hypothetical protein